MRRHALTGTDLEITPIGLGAWGIGGGGWAGGYGDQSDDESIAAIHRAWEAGINWVDTAPIYGLGRSEEVVGRALRDMAERPLVFTKCSLVTDAAGEVVTDLRATSIRAEVERSLERLGIEALDLMQVHWPEPDVGGDLEEAWAELVACRDAGLIRHLGGSNFEPSHVDRVASLAPVETLQPRYSLLDRGVEEAILPLAVERGIGILAYSPLASGLLSGMMTRERALALPADDWRSHDPQFADPGLAEALAVADRLGEAAAEAGCSTAELAVAWVVAHPAVSGAIVGIRSPAHVDRIVGAADVAVDRDALAARVLGPPAA